MTNSIRIVGDDDSLWLRTSTPNAADAIICATHQLNSATVRENAQQRSGRSGVNDLTEFHDDATFQASLTIRDMGGLTRHQWVDRLRAILQPRNRPYLYIQRDGWLTERRATVRGGSNAITNPIDRVSAARLQVSLQVTLPDGVLESADQSSDTIRPASLSSGRTYPKSYTATGWAYTAGSSGAVKTITMGGGEYGTTSAPLLMRLYGACTDPVITNQTLGEVFEMDGVTLTAGQYLEIDMDAETVFLNGDPALPYYNRINFAVSTWWELQPGANSLSVGAATIDDSCELDLFWNDRFAI